jgi:ribosomal protein L14E/L6E/L27E
MYNYLSVGAVVSATAGRERGEIFIIIKDSGEYAYLINGKSRTIENPKKKNKKHLHLLCKSEKAGLDLDQLTNAQVKNFLSNYNKSRGK